MDKRPAATKSSAAAATDSAARRRRGLMLIWGAQLFSLAVFFVLSRVLRPASDPQGNHTLAWMLGALGFMTFLISFLMKRRLLERAVAEQRFDLCTTAYVVAFALCEMTGILGFVAYLVTGLPYALHSFIIATVGMILHFPAREPFDAIEASSNATPASFKTTF